MSSASSSGCELAVGEDRLARAAIADEARQPQVRGAGDDPLVAGGQRAAAALLGEDVVDAQQQLAAAADRERLRRGDPQLLRLRLAEAAVDLVHEPEVADREEQVGDLAAVEVGEVQARAEDPPAGVARMLDDAAAQHRDLHLRVADQQVDAGLQRPGGRVVLGVEVARVAQLDGADVAVAGTRARCRGRPRRSPRTRRRGRARAWSGAASRRSGGGRRPRWRARGRAAGPARSRSPPGPSEQPLALALDLRAARRQAGDELGGRVDEVVGAQAVLAGCR